MNFNNKTILPAITNLSQLLNLNEKDVSDLFDQENQPRQTVIRSSTNSLLNYSHKFSVGLVKSTPVQATVGTLTNSTSTKVDLLDKSVQTTTLCYHVNHKTQTLDRKKKVYSRKTQTSRKLLATIRDTIKVSYPNFSLLSLNNDQFSRLITGKSKITFSQETILQGYKLQSLSGTGAYNLCRSALPNSFPCSKTIRGKISNFCINPGPVKSIIKLFSYRLKTYPAVNYKFIISFE